MFAALGDAVTEAFHAEPAKLDELLELLKDITDDRVDLATGIAKVWGLLKDHPNLRNDFNACCLPDDANKTINDRRSYIDAVKETFKDEPEKFHQFLQIMKDVRTHREDAATGFARLKELMKDHQNLLPDLNAFFPDEAKITIPPEVKTTIALEAKIRTLSDARAILKTIKDPAEYEAYKKLLKDIKARGSFSSIQQNYSRAHSFVAKVQERFQGDDNHVYESFLQIVILRRDGNMSIDEVYREVVTLLKDHQDLVMEFTDFFNQ